MVFTRILCLTCLFVGCFVLGVAGCGSSGSSSKEDHTPAKDAVSKTKEKLLGKWKHEKDKTVITLDFAADKLSYRNNKPDAGPPGETPYKVLDEKTLEMPHLGMTGTEKVTIDRLSPDKLVLSGGDTWKFDKTEFTKEK